MAIELLLIILHMKQFQRDYHSIAKEDCLAIMQILKRDAK